MTAILTPVQIAGNQVLQAFTQNSQANGRLYQQIYNAIWNPPATGNYTTATLLADLGTNAASVLAALAALATYITAIGGTLPTVSGAASYTTNSDGTVTLS